MHSKQTKIHLLSIGPGDDLYAWFGHSALIITQPSGSKVMYDWGIFDPNQEHFYLNFARGRMYYHVAASEATWRIADALEEVRDVSLVELNLTDEAKFALISFLHTHIQGSNSTYLYHFYDDNCATRIRDIINAATDGAFKSWTDEQPLQPSMRNQVMRSMIHSPGIFWVLDFLQGPSIDQDLSVYDTMFLPHQLEKAVLDFSYPDGTSLALSREVLQDTKDLDVRFAVDTSERSYIWFYALVGSAFALLLFIIGLRFPTLKRLLFGLVLFALGLLGTLLLFMMSFSDMDMTYFNENILFVNPLLFIAAFRILFTKRSQTRLLAVYSSIMVALLIGKFMFPTMLDQDNLRVLMLLLPLYLSGSSLKGGAHRETR